MKSRVGSWVTWVKGQSIDGSCRYRVTKYDSLSAPAAINIRLGFKKIASTVKYLSQQNSSKRITNYVTSSWKHLTTKTLTRSMAG